uniref:Translation initiation factor eIF2B subunit gamma n=1 Tax=Meloidogyne javanica TaxID=6303 RepID=A0A915M6E8_MELJA
MNIVEDYVAVVFAGGRGNRMLSITEHIPKHLLPIINIPLFWFPLNLLQRNGFKECLLIVPKTKSAFVNKLLSDGSLPSLDQLKVTISSFDDEEEGAEEFGTADVLLQNLDKLKKKNVLIVSGDLITDLTLEGMLKFHEKENSVLTCLLTDSPLSGAIPGTNERPKKYRDFVMFSPETNQLLYLIDEDDFGDDEKFPASLFKRLSFSSLKADFISNLIYGQFSKSKRRSLGFDEQQKYKCFAYFGNSNDCSFLAQCNNLGAYFEANKIVKKFLPKLCDNLDSKFLGKQTNQKSESWIAENTQIGTKFQLKRSVINEGCIIGDNQELILRQFVRKKK